MLLGDDGTPPPAARISSPALGCSSRCRRASAPASACSPVRSFPATSLSRSWCADSLPAAPIQHIAGLRQGPVQRAVAPHCRTQSPPLPSSAHTLHGSTVPVQRRYLAPSRGSIPTHPAVWPPSCPATRQVAACLAGRYQSATETCRSSWRAAVAPQHSLQCIILAQPATSAACSRH